MCSHATADNHTLHGMNESLVVVVRSSVYPQHGLEVGLDDYGTRVFGLTSRWWWFKLPQQDKDAGVAKLAFSLSEKQAFQRLSSIPGVRDGGKEILYVCFQVTIRHGDGKTFSRRLEVGIRQCTIGIYHRMLSFYSIHFAQRMNHDKCNREVPYRQIFVVEWLNELGILGTTL